MNKILVEVSVGELFDKISILEIKKEKIKDPKKLKHINDEYNILVATSVGEEGLDIPSTDVVIFYEPVSSAIRLIQRRGRTGRNRPGEVFIFVTKESRDEAALWSSRGKEEKMHSLFSAGRIEIDLVTLM